ncbi:MAG: bifunctional lysylphosphatidylglycerol synthetase/lysine--tRNA ligase LysX, partial [Propionibacteriaceae bacterium]
LIAGGLVRRKRAAWLIVFGFEVLSVIWSLFAVCDLFEPRLTLPHTPHPFAIEVAGLIVSSAVLVIFWLARGSFKGKMQRGSWVASLGVITVGILLTAVTTRILVKHFGTAGAPDGEISINAFLWAMGLDDLAMVPRQLRFVPEITGVMMATTLILATWTFMRSARRGYEWNEADEVEVRRLLTRYGKLDSLSYFGTRRDKAFYFSTDRQAVIAYRVLGPVTLASGDPIGNPDSWSDAIRGWLDMAQLNGWVPAVISTSEAGARAYAKFDLEALAMGDESVIQTDSFTLDRTAMTPLRQSVNRARRAGLTTTIMRQHDLNSSELAELRFWGNEWRQGCERGFSMTSSRLADATDPEAMIIRCRDQKDHLVALLTFAPWGGSGLSLDAMRRSHNAPNGAVELMVTDLIAHCSRRGIRQISLNFAMLRQVFAEADRIGATPIDKLNSSMLTWFDRFFQLERLYRSNQKYQPTWVPRFLCFDGVSTLPYVLLAAARAEGYLGKRTPPQPEFSPAALDEIKSFATDPPSLAVTPIKRSDQSTHRIRHAVALTEAGHNPFPVGVERPRSLSTLTHHDWDDHVAVRICGRFTSLRHHGGVIFGMLRDGSTSIQAVLERDQLSPALRCFADVVDRGDLVVLEGTLGESRNGTPSLLVTSWQVVAKAIRPIPLEGISNPEAKLRQRSLDLLTDPHELEFLHARSRIVAAIRGFMGEHGFAEVETPILATTHGGATARPFHTHINAYDTDLYLRIAPELHLKRLIVAGAGPIFEIGRNFRNEGADNTHNPEFTSLEAYEPWGDYSTMMDLTEGLVRAAATAVYGRPVLPLGPDGMLTDISAPWQRADVITAVAEATGVDVSLSMPFDELLQLARTHGIEAHPSMGPGALIEELYAELVESSTITPTFYCNFPAETSPLTAPHRNRDGVVE